MRRRRRFCLAAATLALLTAGAAQAAAPPEAESSSSGTSGPRPAKIEHEGGLPFSALDLALLAAGGGPMLLIGVTLRRRRPEPAVQPAQEETLTLA